MNDEWNQNQRKKKISVRLVSLSAAMLNEWRNYNIYRDVFGLCCG